VTINHTDDEESIPDKTVEPVLRWSERERRPLDYYGERITIADGKPKEPTTLKEALESPNKVKWSDAMEKEMESLRVNVWDLVELPKDRKAVGSKWVFKLKVDSEGSVETHKA